MSGLGPDVGLGRGMAFVPGVLDVGPGRERLFARIPPLLLTFTCVWLTQCVVDCTDQGCSDSFWIRIVQDSDMPTAPGRYSLSFPLNDGGFHTCNAVLVVNEHGSLDISSYSNCYASIDKQSKQLRFYGIADVLKVDGKYVSPPESMTFVVHSDGFILGMESLKPDYHWYWCNGPDHELCNERKNYSVEIVLEVDYPPVL